MEPNEWTQQAVRRWFRRRKHYLDYLSGPDASMAYFVIRNEGEPGDGNEGGMVQSPAWITLLEESIDWDKAVETLRREDGLDLERDPADVVLPALYQALGAEGEDPEDMREEASLLDALLETVAGVEEDKSLSKAEKWDRILAAHEQAVRAAKEAPRSLGSLELRLALLRGLCRFTVGWWEEVGFGSPEDWAYFEEVDDVYKVDSPLPTEVMDFEPIYRPVPAKPTGFRLNWAATGCAGKKEFLRQVVKTRRWCRLFPRCLRRFLAEMPEELRVVFANTVRADYADSTFQEPSRVWSDDGVTAKREPAGPHDGETIRHSRKAAEVARILGDTENKGQITLRNLWRAERWIAERMDVRVLWGAWQAAFYDGLYWQVRKLAYGSIPKADLKAGLAAAGEGGPAIGAAVLLEMGRNMAASAEDADVTAEFFRFLEVFLPKLLRRGEPDGLRQEWEPGAFTIQGEVRERDGWGADAPEDPVDVLFAERKNIVGARPEDEADKGDPDAIQTAREKYVQKILRRRLGNRGEALEEVSWEDLDRVNPEEKNNGDGSDEG